jgi:ABC-type dipeptide/oligopeptide/nickel transport system permease subunit
MAYKLPPLRFGFMSHYFAPAFLKRTRSNSRFVLAGLILVLVWASSIGAQEQPILRFVGRVTYVSPQEMLVALDSGGVVMLDLARIAQGETRQIAQNDYVTVIGFVERPNRRVIATSIQRASPWVPTIPSWAP